MAHFLKKYLMLVSHGSKTIEITSSCSRTQSHKENFATPTEEPIRLLKASIAKMLALQGWAQIKDVLQLLLPNVPLDRSFKPVGTSANRSDRF